MPVAKTKDGFWTIRCLECGYTEHEYLKQRYALDALAEHWSQAECVQDGTLTDHTFGERA